jgi:anion transporter
MSEPDAAMPAQALAVATQKTDRDDGWVKAAALRLVGASLVGLLALMPESLSGEARISLFVFGTTILLWTTSSVSPSFAALAAVIVLVLAGAMPEDKALGLLSSSVVWLMVGAFVLGAAIRKTGLAARLTGWVISRARSVGQLFWLSTAALLPLTLLIPSTSGRAAVALPLFRTLSVSLREPAVVRALGLLVPCVILLSTTATLIGAGSHLIANDLLARISGQRISFLAWLVYGVPFAVVTSALCCLVILKLFLTPEQRRRRFQSEPAARAAWSSAERVTTAVAAAMILLWAASPWHGLGIAIVSLAGALLLAAPRIGVLTWGDALRAVNWNLILFVGAALAMGEALIDTGAAAWIFDNFLLSSRLSSGDSSLLVLAVVAAITLTSHTYITSHTARATALLPPLLYLAQSLGLNPIAVMFIATVGMNYCLTFPVSSKALLIFYGLDERPFTSADLFRLSAVLLPANAALMVLFYFLYWRWIGLAL